MLCCVVLCLMLCAQRVVMAQTIIFGGHSDTWDVGTGSMDDGAGVMIAWQVSGRGYG